jgi:hypothetical protein
MGILIQLEKQTDHTHYQVLWFVWQHPLQCMDIEVCEQVDAQLAWLAKNGVWNGLIGLAHLTEAQEWAIVECVTSLRRGRQT